MTQDRRPEHRRGQLIAADLGQRRRALQRREVRGRILNRPVRGTAELNAGLVAKLQEATLPIGVRRAAILLGEGVDLVPNPALLDFRVWS
jgi:hypothetical protein